MINYKDLYEGLPETSIQEEDNPYVFYDYVSIFILVASFALGVYLSL